MIKEEMENEKARLKDQKLIRSDEGLTLETSAFLIFHGGNSTFINSFDKTKFLFWSLPPTQHYSFFRN